jgi:hypothetical protein
MAVVQAGTKNKTPREVFHEFADGIVHRAGKLLGNLRLAPTQEQRGPGDFSRISRLAPSIQIVTRTFLLCTHLPQRSN